MIRVEDLTYFYHSRGERIRALDRVNLTISEGEFVAIVGANASGKTTLAKHFNALLKPTKGRVLVDGLDTRDPANTLQIRQKVGMILSNPENQIVATIVDEDVAFGLENLQVPPMIMHERVDEALQLTQLTDHRKRNPRDLSDGQKQLLALAGMLAMRPKYVVLDEVTTMLDPRNRERILKLASELKSKEGLTIIWITHRLEEAIHADRVMVMNRGQIIMDGPKSQVLRETRMLASVGLKVPEIPALALELHKLGLLKRSDVFTVEEMVDELCG